MLTNVDNKRNAKWLPRSGKLRSGYKMANKPKKKGKKKRMHGEKEREQREKTATLSEKKEEASIVSEQWDKGWIHVIRVHNTTHLAVTTTRQGNRCSRTTPHKERRSSLIKHWDYPPSLIHRKWTTYFEKQKGKRRDKTVNGKNQ